VPNFTFIGAEKPIFGPLSKNNTGMAALKKAKFCKNRLNLYPKLLISAILGVVKIAFGIYPLEENCYQKFEIFAILAHISIPIISTILKLYL